MTQVRLAFVPTHWLVASSILVNLLVAQPSVGQVSGAVALRDAAMALVEGAAPNAITAEVVAAGPTRGPWPSRGGAYRVDLFEPDPNLPGQEPRRLSGRIRMVVANDGMLVRLSTQIVEVERRLDAFKRAFESHPEWTDADAIAQLRNAGAEYVPLSGSVVGERLRHPALRSWLEVVSIGPPKFRVQFQRAEPEVEGSARTLIAVGWDIDVRARVATGQLHDYVASVEPFFGTISHLMPVD